MRQAFARLLGLAALAWSGWFLVGAFQRWRWEHVCSMVCPPFVPVEFIEQHRRAMDWQTPLLIAVLPLAVLGCWMAFRLLLARPGAR